jgi:hypothetical protein
MQMTWDNLTKFFTWAAQHGSEAPLADTAGETAAINKRIEDVWNFGRGGIEGGK